MMKKLMISFLVALFLLIATPAEAADQGGKIFQANCAVCHAGGGNRIMANKTLKQEALAQYGMDSKDAIVSQVTNGKMAMPMFRGRLNASQIEAVAEYVLSQAEKGW